MSQPRQETVDNLVDGFFELLSKYDATIMEAAAAIVTAQRRIAQLPAVQGIRDNIETTLNRRVQPNTDDIMTKLGAKAPRDKN